MARARAAALWLVLLLISFIPSCVSVPRRPPSMLQFAIAETKRRDSGHGPNSSMNNDTLPRWDMTVVYPSLDSPEFAEGFASVTRGIDELIALFDEHGIMQRPEAAPR